MRLNLNLSEINLINQNSFSNRSVNSVNQKNNARKVPLNILQNCLNSLELFKGLLEDMPHMKNRVVRDASKAIQISTYHQSQIIYDIHQKATAVYFCLGGQVSIQILRQKSQAQSERTQKQKQQGFQDLPEWIQIDSIETGEGFGQGQFIAGIKRSVRASVKVQQTVIGKLQIQSVTEVLQNYRMRVYYKKRDMFLKCPLFQNISANKLQFIASNTKPMSVVISQKIIKEGNKADNLYLINKGKISLWKKNKESSRIQTEMSSVPSLYKLKYKKNVQRIMGGYLEEGGFIGDLQIALNKNYQFTAVAITEKVELYYCNKKIVLSQIREEELELVRQFYQARIENQRDKKDRFNKISKGLEEQKKTDLLPKLNSMQLKLKRKLLHRYFEEKPSLIGSSSPYDIAKMIERKKARIKDYEKNESPRIELFTNHSMKKRYHQKISFSPIPIVKTQVKKSITQMSENPETQNENLSSAKSMMIRIKHKSINLQEIKKKPHSNLGAVSRMLGPYMKHSRLQSCSQVIQQIQKHLI